MKLWPSRIAQVQKLNSPFVTDFTIRVESMYPINKLPASPMNIDPRVKLKTKNAMSVDARRVRRIMLSGCPAEKKIKKLDDIAISTVVDPSMPFIPSMKFIAFENHINRKKTTIIAIGETIPKFS